MTPLVYQPMHESPELARITPSASAWVWVCAAADRGDGTGRPGLDRTHIVDGVAKASNGYRYHSAPMPGFPDGQYCPTSGVRLGEPCPDIDWLGMDQRRQIENPLEEIPCLFEYSSVEGVSVFATSGRIAHVRADYLLDALDADTWLAVQHGRPVGNPTRCVFRINHPDGREAIVSGISGHGLRPQYWKEGI